MTQLLLTRTDYANKIGEAIRQSRELTRQLEAAQWAVLSLGLSVARERVATADEISLALTDATENLHEAALMARGFFVGDWGGIKQC